MNISEDSCRPSDDKLPILLTIFAIQGVYGILSVFIYILNIKALRYHKNNLDGTFRMFYICLAILSIVYFLDHYLIRRYVKLGFFCEIIMENLSEPTFLLNPYKSIASYCPIAILIFHFLIAFHRFSIVVQPMTALHIWEDYRKYVIVVAFLSPLIFMWFMLPTKSYAVIDPEGGGGLDIEYKKVFQISSSFLAFIAASIFGILTLALTIGMLFALAKINMRKMSAPEKSLIFFEILMAIFTFIYAFTQGILYYSIYIIQDPEMKAKVIEYRNFAIDVFILPQAWTLLFLSKSVRAYTFNFIGRKIGIEIISTDDGNNKKSVSKAPSVRNTNDLTAVTH